MNRLLFALILASLASTASAEPLPRGAHSRADELRARRADTAVVRHLDNEQLRLESGRRHQENARMRLERETLERGHGEVNTRHRLPLLGE